MSYEIYLCGNCLGPVWFPWGQFQHLGTGWYCWATTQDGDEDPLGELIGSTPLEELLQLTGEATKLYAAWRENARDRRALNFLAAQLNAGKIDVVERFLGYLAKEETAEQRGAFVRRLVSTPEWGAFVTARAEARPARRRSSSKANARTRSAGRPAASKRRRSVSAVA